MSDAADLPSPDGEVVRRDAAGAVVERAVFRNGVLHGPWRLYAPGGALIREAEYVDGRAHGLAVDYDAAGRPLAETRWENGRRQGAARVWNGGRLALELVWKDDVLDGPVTVRDPGGAVAAVAPHRAGAMHGLVEAFDPHGRRIVATEYADGVKHGDSVVYAPDGSEIERTRWIDGRPADAPSDETDAGAAAAPDPARAFYAALKVEATARDQDT